MRRILYPFLGLALAASFDSAPAIDINPSKTTVPRSVWDSGGASDHFSIFNGDPKRIQRANAVDPLSFDTKLDFAPNPFSLKSIRASAPNPSLRITFSVHNHAKKTYILSFPSAQRWDFRILNAAGAPVYVYSDNCEFEQKVGSSMVNNDDKLVYTETVDLTDISPSLSPGTYKIQAVLANYPEMNAQAQLTVLP